MLCAKKFLKLNFFYLFLHHTTTTSNSNEESECDLVKCEDADFEIPIINK